MLLFIRVFLVLYGIIAIATGIGVILEPYDGAIAPFEDNSHRFIGAIWASTALGFFYVTWKPAETGLFRFLLAALFLGGIVRAAALVLYAPDPAIIAIIALELIPTPLMWYFQSRLKKSGRIN
ncbi:DUF4345 family protein [Aquisalinus flavus]|uniref:DUF4345 domain-containing protein n=1 Tax=Aquisalinus flavus TaxID=1526572 RepID=A0A8J2V1S9_9PROT|nr:DUF4345 family protein [Aquisalinus flavus]MBD0425983.1 DUF4345 family protein [Aquisalinus flavus]UNE48426.1 DUF4345 domain-containing protein [Aquisalinus flavus]GGD11649.1 hypothetical protein GCM10011342_20590 [Aquisalinus flavus]